ncbi:ATP-grasp domain-containing protein [Bacteroides pyogenes]|jgi:biotin carboxylase|uniref:ATP-grasp domain-containing protein n=1 Tax=Bacteroides pyogenes TaxID=310300 RepID=A0A5D3FP69_9BACE|nr:hypothetical protein [Bacteroides pyogenes]MCI7070629.1 hypothetical protein [Bacteroides pyogenes]TYK32207.1 hypothetical protein FNJ60_13080 [Bacteroides pyogenes]TYK49999.1 hypothetical protein FNG97_04885 [Bacteroides pyogenes]
MKKDLAGKRLLMMSGSRAACEIVNIAHEMGMLVYETDWYETSPVKEVADKAFMISTADTDAVVELCRKEQVDGIFSGYTDSVLPYQQVVCEKLDKPFWGNKDNVAICIDKKLFKQACEDSGVPVVPYYKLNANNYLSIVETIEFPVAIKPVDNSGSRGVFKCYKKEDYEELCEKSLSFSYSKEILVEKLMNVNNEFSVYYIMNEGNVFLSAMGDRYIYEISPDIAPVGQGMSFPSVKLDMWIKKVDSKMKTFFKKNKMDNGFVFVQGFYENDNFYIHEIGYRLNGGFSFRIIEHFSGYNQVEQLLRFAVSGKMEFSEISKSNPHFKGYSFLLTTALTNGEIGSIQGIDEIRSLPGVIRCYPLHDEGDRISAQGTTGQVFSYTICCAPTVEELKDTIDQVKALIKVEDINGNNMLIPMIESNRLKF